MLDLAVSYWPVGVDILSSNGFTQNPNQILDINLA